MRPPSAAEMAPPSKAASTKKSCAWARMRVSAEAEPSPARVTCTLTLWSLTPPLMRGARHTKLARPRESVVSGGASSSRRSPLWRSTAPATGRPLARRTTTSTGMRSSELASTRAGRMATCSGPTRGRSSVMLALPNVTRGPVSLGSKCDTLTVSWPGWALSGMASGTSARPARSVRTRSGSPSGPRWSRSSTRTSPLGTPTCECGSVTRMTAWTVSPGAALRGMSPTLSPRVSSMPMPTSKRRCTWFAVRTSTTTPTPAGASSGMGSSISARPRASATTSTSSAPWSDDERRTCAPGARRSACVPVTS